MIVSLLLLSICLLAVGSVSSLSLLLSNLLSASVISLLCHLLSLLCYSNNFVAAAPAAAAPAAATATVLRMTKSFQTQTAIVDTDSDTQNNQYISHSPNKRTSNATHNGNNTTTSFTRSAAQTQDKCYSNYNDDVLQPSSVTTPQNNSTLSQSLYSMQANTSDSKSGKNSARVIGSGIAGLTELMLFHPVDTCAKRLMTSTEKYVVKGHIMSNLNRIIFKSSAHETNFKKFKSLFPGLGFAAGYKVTQRIYKFGGQPFVNDYLFKYHHAFFQKISNDDAKRAKTLMHATAGSLIGIGEIILLPLDVLKIKAQTNPDSISKNLIATIRQEGFMKLYSGATFTAMRNAPGSFALFGGAATSYQYIFHLKDYKEATFFQNFIASCCGSIASIAVSSPFDTIKSRIQKQGWAENKTGIQMVRTLIANEGPTAFFKGLTPKILAVSPKLCFSFTIAQWIIAKLEKQNIPL